MLKLVMNDMIDMINIISKELSLQEWQVSNALELRSEGGTIPFIARYRKERTGTLDENQLRDLFDRADYLKELEDRKQTILKSIEEQGKLTDELKAKIENCLSKTELEDLYLPYKPKRRTRATIAREKGLEPLAEFIKDHNSGDSGYIDLIAEAAKYISEEKGVETAEDAIKGASDIVAEEISEDADLRAWIRNYIFREGVVYSWIKDEHPEGSTKYEMYREFEAPVKRIVSHNMLALRRGEKEDILGFDIKFDIDEVLGYIEYKKCFASQEEVVNFFRSAIKDCFARLIKHSILGEIRNDRKEFADLESIDVFEKNLRQALLSAPAGMKPTMGIDPGFRTGCKIAIIDSTGKFIEYETIYPTGSDYQKMNAEETVKDMIIRHDIGLIGIGNGTAGRETDKFVSDIIAKMKTKPVKVLVNEAGASVYSASKTANEEFPDLDVSIRGAISIARRLQDPLAELVKIDPKSIGVGQYQHDVDQKLLKKKLEETVESCVNYVGVDLNTASKELLIHVSGLSKTIAKNIVLWRDENGAFKNRKQLMKVPKFGPKAFELSAGFLRIREGENMLDNTAVHPESYHIVENFATDLQVKPEQLAKMPELLKKINIKNYISDTIGEPTLLDIISELEKPGRDPRDEFKYAEFMEGINAISDLKIGMELEGVVTNITNFGAFVDIGVHQDGLVHISEIANTFVKDPAKFLNVGQIVKVLVLNVDEKLKRINLSIKQAKGNNPKQKK